MADDYTPTTDEIESTLRSLYRGGWDADSVVGRNADSEFDRLLAEVAEKARARCQVGDTSSSDSITEQAVRLAYEKAEQRFPDNGPHGEHEWAYRHFTDGIDAMGDALAHQAPATESGVAAVLALHKRVTVPDNVDAEDAEVGQECHAHDDERGVLARGQWPCATITAMCESAALREQVSGVPLR